MGWLALAIAFEVTGTVSMKLSKGFSHGGYAVLMFACYGISLACLTMALRRIELSIAYAIWSAVGTSLIAVIGVVLFKEAVTVVKVVSLVLVVIGVVGLKLSEPPSDPGALRTVPSTNVNGLNA